MHEIDVGFRILLAFVIGGIIGLEREINEKKDTPSDGTNKLVAILGVRSFSLVAGLGALIGFLSPINLPFALILTGSLILLILAFYLMESRLNRDTGITTELAMIFSLVLGFLLTLSQFPIQLTFAISIVLILLMSRKEKIKGIVEDIKKREIDAFIAFAILAFVILPFLPNTAYSLADFKGLENFLKNTGLSIESIKNIEVFNPFKLWFIVVLITGVDVLGYLLERTIGSKKGWLLTSLAGGFVSSTATTVSLAKQSIHNKNINLLLSSAIFANLISFLPVIFILATLNTTLLLNVLPILMVIIIAFLLIGLYFLWQSGKGNDQIESKEVTEKHKIFDLPSALKFVGLFLAINIISKFAIEFFGSSGFLITSTVGALPGIDAVVINTAQLAGSKISYELAIWGLVLINAVNLVAKTFYSFLQGDKRFALMFFVSVLIIISSSILAVFLF